ncbi:MAG: hypothetical protein ABR936_17535 [Bacteroidota bacterium]
MTTKNMLSSLLKGIQVSIPFIGPTITFDFNEISNTSNVDERIAKLGQIQTDLRAAIDAVDLLKSEAELKKIEAEQLRTSVENLKQEQETAKTLLSIPEGPLMRLLIRANCCDLTWRVKFLCLIILLTA